MDKKRIFYLDFIRTISTILIVIYHFNNSIIQHKIKGISIFFNKYANGDLGDIGVVLFFIISGSALMYTYEENLSIKNFFYKRFTSLYPMFWITYIIAFLYLFYVNGTIKSTVPNWTFILTIIGMDGYLYSTISNFYILGEWFLGCIILIYICFPLLRKVIIKYPKLFMIGMCIYYIVFVQLYNFEMMINRNFLIRIFDFIIGMYFAKYVKEFKIQYFILALIIGITIIFVPIHINKSYITTALGVVLVFMLGYLCKYVESWNIKNICNIVSKYSYAIFLVHHVIIEQIIKRFDKQAITNYETICLFLITCITIAMISQKIYTMPKKLILFAKSIVNEK